MNILYGLLFILIGTTEIFNLNTAVQFNLNNINKHEYIKLLSGLLKIFFGIHVNLKVLLKVYNNL